MLGRVFLVAIATIVLTTCENTGNFSGDRTFYNSANRDCGGFAPGGPDHYQYPPNKAHIAIVIVGMNATAWEIARCGQTSGTVDSARYAMPMWAAVQGGQVPRWSKAETVAVVFSGSVRHDLTSSIAARGGFELLDHNYSPTPVRPAKVYSKNGKHYVAFYLQTNYGQMVLRYPPEFRPCGTTVGVYSLKSKFRVPYNGAAATSQDDLCKARDRFGEDELLFVFGRGLPTSIT